jgi:hypothetical protein
MKHYRQFSLLQSLMELKMCIPRISEIVMYLGQCHSYISSCFCFPYLSYLILNTAVNITLFEGSDPMRSLCVSLSL